MSESRVPNPVLSALGKVLEAGLNQALALDGETRAQLGPMDGRRVGVQMRGTGLDFSVWVDGPRLRVGPHWESPSDLDIRAAPASLLAFGLRRNESSSLPPGKVDISGDAELARRVEKLLRGFNPDFEEKFAAVFGDVAGVPIARGIRGALAWSRASAKALLRDSAEFLREESRDLIAPAEMEAFLDDVDALRERGERLEARLRNLEVRSKPPQ